MLIDSTIYIDLLRRGEDILYVLKPSLLSGQLEEYPNSGNTYSNA
ncbi:MAG TPA: hypothetical protein VN957_06200 [Chthoniobacterales bacterium]|jgi:hypothetical protein|nr:hypothetical protein [Chthoniobacterales bacterium]